MLGRTLIFIGVIILVIGILLLVSPKIPFLGKLPGDIYYKKDNFTLYFPFTTSIIISIIISFLLYIFTRR
ncbi:MAG: DUF2905 domain-containing protein [Thermodesulfobacteriota bacterium]|nr:MAG: DUF2905 domain-containing protein [Thermodesulfobacteriota bacterium]